MFSEDTAENTAHGKPEDWSSSEIRAQEWQIVARYLGYWEF